MTSADDAAAAHAARRAADRLAKMMTRLAAQARTARPGGFRLPELDADPDVDDPTNAWVLADGRLRIRTSDGVVHEYLDVVASRPSVPTFAGDPAASTGYRLWFSGATGRLRGRLANGAVSDVGPTTTTTSPPGGAATPGPAASAVLKPTDPDLKSHRQVYRADWARTYCARHGLETADHLHYGRRDDTHGQRRIMLGFNDEAIRADLAGANVKKVELRALNTDAWAPTGLTVHWGAHDQDRPPTSYSAIRANAYEGQWPATGWGGNRERWRTISTWFGRAFRDNQIKGLTIDQPGGVLSSGEIDWSTVELAIQYIK